MARFRFDITDSTGRRRKGVLRAESRLEAENVLRSKLCVIEELTPLDDEAGPATGLDRLEASFSLADRVRAVIALALAAVLVLSLVIWARSPKPEKIAENEKIAGSFGLAVQGRLDTTPLSGSSVSLSEYFNGPEDLTVYVVFPELAYDVESKVAEDGTFRAPISLSGASRPTQMLLEVAIGSQRWPVSELTAVPSGGALDMGVLAVRPPPKGFQPLSTNSSRSNVSTQSEPTPPPSLSPEQMRLRRVNRVRGTGI